MIDITVEKRKIPYGNTEVKLGEERYALHTFQEIFYSDLNDLPTVTVVVAPTGAGKTFAFSLPVIYAKNHDCIIPPRGLVVAPTNALIEDMYNSFKKVVKVEKITGNTLQKHGSERAKELLDKVQSANVVITNPDIVNFVIHGGYHIDESGRRRHIFNFQDWTEFFGKMDYIIFDEYHLYDEEELANILTWLLSNYQFFRSLKWFFISATPEPLLLKILDGQRIEYKIVQQKLADSGRVIQGRQKIHFVEISQSNSLYKWLFNDRELVSGVKDKISDAIKGKKRVFFLFNSLREAKSAECIMRANFDSAKIGVNTGFETRQKGFVFDPEDYDIIITTSKAEVGVNYPVQLAYIDSGKYLRNFLQRIGRIGRRGEENEIYCATPIGVVENIKKNIVSDSINTSYYEFVEVLNNSFEDLKLKEEKIPLFMGAVLWSIYNALKSYDRRRVVGELSERFPYSKLLFRLDALLENAEGELDEDAYANLKAFWKAFKKSFMRFRDDSTQWKIFYKNQETEYDIMWIFNNAFIEKIDKDEKTISINDFRSKKEEIVKGILTPSVLEDPYRDQEKQQIGGIGYEPEKEWREFTYSDHIGKIYIRKLDKWLSEVDIPKELEELLKRLELVYSKRRIEILDVLYDSVDVIDSYII